MSRDAENHDDRIKDTVSTGGEADDSMADDRLFDEFLDRILAGEILDAAEFAHDQPSATPSLIARLEALHGSLSGDSHAMPAVGLRPADDLPFAAVAGFRLIRRIGRGGMGSVFLAEQTSLKRLVALKIIDESRGVSETARARFLEEAQVIAEISHPNIVRVIEFGETDGVQYLVMELVSGRDLESLLDAADETIPLHRCLKWFHQIAQALDHAHRRGIVHRDVKPSNIQINLDDDAVLLDFGLARALDRATRTLPGVFLGTAAYASPEQSDSKPGWSSPLTDVYSLGACLYRALCGELPAHGSSNEELLRSILTKDPVPLQKIDKSIPRDVQTVVEKAMERDCKNRYQSAAKFAEDLQAVLELRPISARPPSFATRGIRWVRRHPFASNSIFVVLAGILVFASFFTIQYFTRVTDAAGHLDQAIGYLREYDEVLPEVEYREERLRFLDRWREEERFALRSARDTLERSIRRNEKLLITKDPASGLSPAEIESQLLSIRDRIDNNQRSLDSVETSYRTGRTESEGLLSGYYARMQSALAQTKDALNDAKRLQSGLANLTETHAAYLMTCWRDAGRLGRDAELLRLENLVRATGSAERYDLELRGMARLDCTALPPDSELHLFRYAFASGRNQLGFVTDPEQDPGRWFPVPAFGGLPFAEQPAEPLTYVESSVLDNSKVVELEHGSYLLVLRPQDVRYPLLLSAGETCVATFGLTAELEAPPGFIAIPKGEFVYGGDMFAPNASRRSSIELDTFWIMEREVSWGEYAEFLNGATGADCAPRGRDGSAIWSEYQDVDRAYSIPTKLSVLPIVGISFDSARAYATWRNDRAQSDGDAFRYALPDEREWEKACRGIDGRPYPWGGSWAGVTYFDLKRSMKGEVIEDHVRDRSVYALRNVTGSVAEFCKGADNGEPLWRGLFFAPGYRHHHAARAAARLKPFSSTDVGVGFRLVARIDRHD